MRPTFVNFRSMLLAAAIAAVVAPGAESQEALTLSLDDMEAEPGKVAVLVVRSYQPRPISQGQVCFIIGEPRFTALRRAVARSTMRDAVTTANLTSPFEAAMTMSSPSATINAVEGPVMLIAFTVDPTAVPGESFTLSVDLPDSFLVDAAGGPVSLEILPGTFTVKTPGGPHELEADNAKAPAGSLVVLDVATAEYQPLASGHIEYRYDTALVESIQSVRVLALRNDANVMADASIPGRISISFSSPSRTIAKIPGQFIEITAQLRPGLAHGTRGRLAIERSTAVLVTNGGVTLPLDIEDGDLIIENR